MVVGVLGHTGDDGAGVGVAALHGFQNFQLDGIGPLIAHGLDVVLLGQQAYNDKGDEGCGENQPQAVDLSGVFGKDIPIQHNAHRHCNRRNRTRLVTHAQQPGV